VAVTGRNVCEPFLSAWRATGLEFDGQPGRSLAESTALLGLPLTAARIETLSDGSRRMVQWFERARAEDHGADGVLFGLLGIELADQ
jgi:thermitase